MRDDLDRLNVDVHDETATLVRESRRTRQQLQVHLDALRTRLEQHEVDQIVVPILRQYLTIR